MHSADPADPEDLDLAGDVAGALAGTHWTLMMEGSMGTYYTWYSFDNADFGVLMELRNGWEDGVLWRADGDWSVSAAGVVDMRWSEYQTWHSTDPCAL